VVGVVVGVAGRVEFHAVGGAVRKIEAAGRRLEAGVVLARDGQRRRRHRGKKLDRQRFVHRLVRRAAEAAVDHACKKKRPAPFFIRDDQS